METRVISSFFYALLTRKNWRFLKIMIKWLR